MVVKNKYAGVILLIITLCLLGVTAFYNIKNIRYKSVDAHVISIDYENTSRNSNVNHFVILAYEYNSTQIESKLYVSANNSYKVNDKISIKINPDNPSEIMDNSMNKYFIPLIIIIIIFDFLYLKSKNN